MEVANLICSERRTTESFILPLGVPHELDPLEVISLQLRILTHDAFVWPSLDWKSPRGHVKKRFGPPRWVFLLDSLQSEMGAGSNKTLRRSPLGLPGLVWAMKRTPAN